MGRKGKGAKRKRGVMKPQDLGNARLYGTELKNRIARIEVDSRRKASVPSLRTGNVHPTCRIQCTSRTGVYSGNDAKK